MPLLDFGPTDAIAVGAVVELESAPQKSAWYLIGPRAGALEVHCEGRDVLVVTAQSPLGQRLIGRRAGDVVPAAGRGSTTTLRILSVH